MAHEEKTNSPEPQYFLTHPLFGEKQVTKKEWIEEERRQGFVSKFGPDHPATGGFGTSGGISGSIRYTTQKNAPDQE